MKLWYYLRSMANENLKVQEILGPPANVLCADDPVWVWMYTRIPKTVHDEIVRRMTDLLIKEKKELSFLLERDRTAVAEQVTKILQELESYSWLIEGRGSYKWNDDRWHEEFKRASEAIRKAVEPLQKIAADWQGCPLKTEEVQAARKGQ